MKVLCFGGTFNPIHSGHLICARAVAEAGGFQRVLLVPSAHPPHKRQSPDIASAAHRLRMCRLAAAEQPELFAVSDLELKRPAPSFTLQTVRELKRRGMQNVHWLIGADMLADLPNWHRIGELVREVTFVIMARPGWRLDWRSLPSNLCALRHNVVEAPLVDISATGIRKRAREGLSLAWLVPPSVATYLKRHRLYER
jgi:nicotinate-nucleotide adenylyltransferase